MIEIINYERVNEKSKIGYVDIYLPKRKEFLSHIPHLQSGERRWFSLPAFGRKMPDGSTRYLPIWRLDPDIHNGELLEALHDPVKAFCLKNHIEDVPPLDLSAPGFCYDGHPFKG